MRLRQIAAGSGVLDPEPTEVPEGFEQTFVAVIQDVVVRDSHGVETAGLDCRHLRRLGAPYCATAALRPGRAAVGIGPFQIADNDIGAVEEFADMAENACGLRTVDGDIADHQHGCRHHFTSDRMSSISRLE
jgi:hypothetical protein